MNCNHFIFQIWFKVSHIFPKGNGVVDILSKMGVSASSVNWWLSLPETYVKAHRDDMWGGRAYRFC